MTESVNPLYLENQESQSYDSGPNYESAELPARCFIPPRHPDDKDLAITQAMAAATRDRSGVKKRRCTDVRLPSPEAVRHIVSSIDAAAETAEDAAS